MSNIQSTTTLEPSEHRSAGTAALVTEFTRFMRLMKRANSQLMAQQTKDGVEQAAFLLLAVLATEGPQRTTALAEAVHSDTSTVSRQVGALVRHGLVERQADPADGRACLLVATENGQQCFERQRKMRTDQLAELLAHWTPEELRDTTTALARLNTEFERHEQQLHSGGTSGHPATMPAAQRKGGTR